MRVNNWKNTNIHSIIAFRNQALTFDLSRYFYCCDILKGANSQVHSMEIICCTPAFLTNYFDSEVAFIFISFKSVSTTYNTQ